MSWLLTILAALWALLGATPFIRPRTRAGQALLWPPKLLGGALSPVIGLAGALAALLGLVRRDWKLAGAGLLGAGLAARLLASLPDVDQELAGLPARDGADQVPGTGEPAAVGLIPAPAAPLALGRNGSRECERNLVIGRKPESGRPLRADLWPPAAPGGTPSGLGLIYAHGSGWRVGDKDMLTRPFFRRLAAQGHLVLDLGYSLWPTCSVPGMVTEVNQAVLWLKENGPSYGVNPDRIVLMGGSAGGHLVLMAAYTPGHPAFRPAHTISSTCNTSVRGVVAFYPPVDLVALEKETRDSIPVAKGATNRLALAMLDLLFKVRDEEGRKQPLDHFLAEMLGGTADKLPDLYRLLSPIAHVDAHCPPTLLIQGTDDVFGLAPDVRRLHECLRSAGVPSVLLEFPHTEHGFDLLLPRLSPPVRAATRGVVQFLAWLQ